MFCEHNTSTDVVINSLSLDVVESRIINNTFVNLILSLSTVVLNSRDRQGMYGMQHFRTPRNPPYKRV